jgi:hypothetical protein
MKQQKQSNEITIGLDLGDRRHRRDAQMLARIGRLELGSKPGPIY